MPDISPELLPGLKAQRLPGLDLGGDFIYPAYNGRSVLNLPDTVCRLLGVEGIAGGPLAPDLLARLPGGERRVILLVVDALALHRLRRWIERGSLPVWKRLAERGLLAPLTSVTPSTTSSVLTSLWTGRSPAEHGITGYEMWMKEYGIVANTIAHSPSAFRGDSGSLQRAGFDPEQVLTTPTLGVHLAAQGVQPHVFQHASIVRSGLSQMYFDRVTVQPFFTASDLWINLRKLFESRPGEPLYAYVYWSEVDTFSHRYGPNDERTEADFAAFSTAFERLFLEQLNPAARDGVTLLLTADHGQISTTPDPHYELRNHPSLTRRLHLQPTGENRLAYFYIRPGQTEAVREYLERTWPNQFSVVDAPYAVEAGLFGPGEPHPALLERVGDLVVVARGNAYLWWANKENRQLGRHGGLHAEEMIVPLLAAPL